MKEFEGVLLFVSSCVWWHLRTLEDLAYLYQDASDWRCHKPRYGTNTDMLLSLVIDRWIFRDRSH